jgi:hypothetical protein
MVKLHTTFDSFELITIAHVFVNFKRELSIKTFYSHNLFQSLVSLRSEQSKTKRSAFIAKLNLFHGQVKALLQHYFEAS